MFHAHREYQEKRDFIRMRVDTPAIVSAEDGGQFDGICHNLSGGGMFISVSEALPIGAKLEVRVQSNHGHNPMLLAKTVVTRVVSQPDTIAQPCFIGLRILEVLS